MALIGPMKYLTIGDKTYEIDSGGSPDIYWVTYGTDINKTEFESAITDGKLVVLTSTEKEYFYVLQQYYDDYAIFSSVGSLSSGMCVLVTTADVSSSTTVWDDFQYGLEADVFFVDLSSTTLNWSDFFNAKNSNKVIVGYRGTVNNTEYYTFLKYYYNSGTYYLTFVGSPATSGGEYVKYYYGSGSGTSVTWTSSDYSYLANAPFYGTCSTTASTAQKEVTANGFKFYSGSILGVNFSTANTADTPTLKLNGSGYTQSILVGTSTPNGTTNVLKWSANTTVYFMWDGTNFRYITSVSAGTVEPSRGANTWYGTSTTTAATQAKTSTINNFVLTKGALASIRFTYANTYTSAKITLNINSTGAKDVYYNGTVTSNTNTLLWNAGEVLTFMYDGTGYQYTGKSVQKISQLTNDSGYTSNTGTVTSVGISNATNGGLSVSGSPVTSSGSITVGHSNVLTSAQTTQAVYPIAIDKNGHISSYGNAVTVPNNSNWVNGSATGSLRTVGSLVESSDYTIGQYAVAEGFESTAGGVAAHSEGVVNGASGDHSHAEGEYGDATGEASHSEGSGSTASGFASHAEGYAGVASGISSHVEGQSNVASGASSHAEGSDTVASGFGSHAEGSGTTANHKSQHVFGEYNVLDASTDPNTERGTYVEIVGKGTSTSARSNARTLDWDGNETLAGKLTLGAAPTANMDAATKQYVDNAMTVVTLNGTTTSNASFYAPTSAGTSNYFLKSSGSGAPTWSQPIKYGTSLPASGDFIGQVFILIE